MGTLEWKQKVLVSVRRAKTSHMHWHAKPTGEKKPENIIIHGSGKNSGRYYKHIRISEESGSNVIIYGLVPRKGYLNTKERNINNRLRDYCGNRMLTFLKHDNINAKTYCDISGLKLNKGVSLFHENVVNLLNTLDLENWHKDQNSEGKKTVNTEVSEDSVTTDNETDCFTKVALLHKKHLQNLFFGHLNINWLRNKSEFLEPLTRNHFDIFWSEKQKLILVSRGLNLHFPVIDNFVKTEIKMEEVWFFMWTRIFLVKLLIL